MDVQLISSSSFRINGVPVVGFSVLREWWVGGGRASVFAENIVVFRVSGVLK